jgi:anti-anti-sigma factor
MEINTRKEKNAVVVSVKGRMDAVSSADFEKELATLMAEGESTFIIDFGELDYISSAGVRSILIAAIAAKKLKAKEGYLSLCSLKDLVEEVFKISGFSSIIPIYESVNSALAHI